MESIPVLSADNVYLSKERKSAFWARLFPSLYVYIRFFKAIFPSAKKGKNHYYPDSEYVRDSLSILRIMEDAGVRFHIQNLHVIKRLNTPCVYIANHMSMLETFILNVMIRPYQKMTFVVKQSLLEYPFFQYLLRDRNPIAVTRKNPRKDLMLVLEEGLNRLQNGISVIVFPQTTRSLRIDPESFNSIGVKLAQKAGVPIIPVALKTDVWGNGKWLKDLGKIDPSKTVHFYFGEPVPIGKNKREVHEQIIDFIRSKLNQWNDEASQKEP